MRPVFISPFKKYVRYNNLNFKRVVNLMSELSEENLVRFTGSDTFTEWSPVFRKSLLTEGALFVAEQGDAYWLFDLIETHLKVNSRECFVEASLSVSGSSGVVELTDGDGVCLASQELGFTDFPEPGVTIWSVVNEHGGRTHMLPSEY